MYLKKLAETVFTAMKECFLVLDSQDLKILLANRHFYHTFKATNHDIEGKSIYEALTGQCNTNILKEALEIVLPRENQFEDLEFAFFSPLLGEKIVSFNGYYVGVPGEQRVILIIARDITELKQKEGLIRKREAELHSLAEYLQAVIVHYNKEGRIIYANPGIEKMAGYGVDFYVGKTETDLIPVHGNATLVVNCLKQVFDTGERLTTELAVGNPPHEKYFQTFFIPEFSRTGAIVRVIKIMHDITASHKLNLQLQNARDKIFHILESISDGFIAIDRQWRFTYVNTSAALLVDFNPVDMVGKLIWDVFPVLKTRGYDRYYFQAMQERVTCEFEMEHPVTGNGWFNIRIYPSEEGLTIYWTDITAKKEAAEILKRDKEALEQLVRERTKNWQATQEELNRAKRLADIGTLAAIVAHELRNPLSAIELAAYNLQKKCGRQQNIFSSHFRTIADKIQESNQIIDNLLYYTRIRPAVLEEVNLQSIIRECEQTVKTRAKKPAIVLADHLDNLKNLTIKADPTQLKEALFNVLNNAYEALTDSGQIDVNAIDENKYLRIAVKDNGPGIDQEIIQKVFEPFFTTKTRGTGLGLAVARQIAENHHGKIEIESIKGQGTTVILIFAKE